MSNPLFSFLKDLLEKNDKNEEELSAGNYSGYQYMINRYISMKEEFIELANLVDLYKVNDEKMHFDFYYNIIPRRKGYIKYIKNENKNKSTKKISDLIDKLQPIYQISKSEIKTYLDKLDKKQIKELELEFGGRK